MYSFLNSQIINYIERTEILDAITLVIHLPKVVTSSRYVEARERELSAVVVISCDDDDENAEKEKNQSIALSHSFSISLVSLLGFFPVFTIALHYMSYRIIRWFYLPRILPLILIFPIPSYLSHCLSSWITPMSKLAN